MNKKGFTVIEFALSFVLLSIIVILLFQTIVIVKELYVSALLKTKLLTKQSVIVEKLYDELFSKEISIIASNTDESIKFVFNDGTSKTLSYDRENNTIRYGEFNTKLIDGSSFGNVSITTETILDVLESMNNSILRIKFPVYHPLLPQEDFGVNMIYQYNNRAVSVTASDIIDNVDAEKTIYLTGGADMITFVGHEYEEPGYYVVDQDNNTSYNDPTVEIVGTIGTVPNTTYTLTYSVYNSGGMVVDRKTRRVTLLSSVNNFTYSNTTKSYTIPIDGLYQLEVWGAEGGSADANYDKGGKGGYTTGSYYFTKGDILYIYVGEKGAYSTTGSVFGGYNGGGTSGAGTVSSGGAGGGATDIRTTLNLINRVIVAGGGGGSGSRKDASYIGAGGAGGGLVGGSPTYINYNEYNGSGGNSEFGGNAGSYITDVTSYPTAGSAGAGGSGGTYNLEFGGGGGGGGWNGGGGGVRYGGGGGGSGYCGSMINCISYSGIETFVNPDGNYSSGHSGDGHARITLVTITS